MKSKNLEYCFNVDRFLQKQKLNAPQALPYPSQGEEKWNE